MSLPFRKQLSRFIANFALWAQRQSWHIPRAIRMTARNSLLRIIPASDLNPVDDWSLPLIVRRPTRPSILAEMPTAVSATLPTASRVDRHDLSAGYQSSTRLRCLIVTTVLDAGGIDEVVAFLARQLPASGLDTMVMCASSYEAPAHVGRLAAALSSEGVSVFEVSPDKGREWLAANRPDVISAHAPPGWILEAADIYNIPVIETLHGVPTPIGTDWSKERARARYIASLVAVSDLVRQQYLRGNPDFAAKEIVTIPNAYNATHRPAIDRIQARAWLGLEDEFLFVSFARLVLQKNAYGLVTAFSEVARAIPRAHLLIAGRPDDRPYVEQVRLLRDRLPERNRIHLRDNLPNPSALLAAADGFVQNSFYEGGFPLACMEALGAGLPVIISDVAGAREQIGEDGERGYVVPNPLGDPVAVTWESIGREKFRPHLNKDELVAAMVSVIGNREHWADVRPTLAEKSRRHFCPRTCAEKHASVLRGAAAARATRSIDRIPVDPHPR